MSHSCKALKSIGVKVARVLAGCIIFLCIAFTSMAQDNIFPSSGNVGIGFNPAPYKLTVNGDIAMPGGWVFRNTSGPLYLQTDNAEPIIFRTGGMVNKMFLKADGGLQILSLGGSGTRMVVTDAQGNLSAQAIPSGSNSSITVAGINGQFQFNKNGALGATANMYWDETTGGLGIGTSSLGTNKLVVDGNIAARKVRVTSSNSWPDYVFEKEYKLMPIDQLASYVAQHKHLPDVPDAKSVEAMGIELAEMQSILLKKIEELTLYSIQQQNAINQQKELLNKQKELLEKQARKIEALEAKK